MLSVKYFFGKNISPKPFLDCENGRKNSKNKEEMKKIAKRRFLVFKEIPSYLRR